MVGKGNQWLDNNALDSAKSWEEFSKSDFFYKIGTWNPKANGVRYLKMLLYNMGMNLTEEDLDILRNITNRNILKTYDVKINGVEIDFDYIQVIDEIQFLSPVVKKSKNILEIGSGYGRTCHAMLCNFDTIESYIIADLDAMLIHSKEDLKNTLSDENYKKVTFISVESQLEDLLSIDVDLTIQIDAFNEMDKKDIIFYLKMIDKNSKYFYTKNPLGKYTDASLDNHWSGNKAVENVMNSGLLTDVIDIDDSEAIITSVPKFVETYTPSKKWLCHSDKWAKPTPFMWQAIYKRESVK